MSGSSLFVTAQQKPGAQVRLFCFPHAGGGPPSFFAWNGLLGPQIECVCVQYPGRAQRWREPARSSLADLVEEIASRWEEVPPKAFAFYGHSFGGLVAFETARRLGSAAVPGPEWLFVGASRAPQLDLCFPPIHELPDEQFVDAVNARYGGIPEQIRADPEALDLFLRPMKVDLQAYELYRMEEEAVLTVPITAFAGAEDRSVPPHRMQGWGMRTQARFELKVLPGGHFFTQDNLKAVTDRVREQLLAPGGRQNTTETTGVYARAETK
jgi:medium-chain acyl-[acyl-carrier-protein] hydrolase